MSMTQIKKAPPPLEGRRHRLGDAAAPGAAFAQAGNVSYSMALSFNDGDFVVTAQVLNATGQTLVGDDDWIGIYANQTALNKDIQSVNAGGSGGAYADWEWVQDFKLTGTTLTWDSGESASPNYLLGYFAKDFVSGNYRFVGQVTGPS